jgi:hypothetical protein
VNTTSSLEELLGKLDSLMQEGDKVCIGIDGMDGIGKTPLARKLAPLLGAQVISLDVDSERFSVGCWYMPHALHSRNSATSFSFICGFNKLSTVPVGSFPKAALVGAKTVNGPGPCSVSTSPAAFTAATRVV